MGNIVEAGKLFVFSSGEYSDFGYEGMFLALEPVTTEVFQAVVDAVKKDINDGKVNANSWNDEKLSATSDEWEKKEAIRNRFIPQLIKTGKIVAIDFDEIHIGSYGRLEITGVDV